MKAQVDCGLLFYSCMILRYEKDTMSHENSLKEDQTVALYLYRAHKKLPVLSCIIFWEEKKQPTEAFMSVEPQNVFNKK